MKYSHHQFEKLVKHIKSKEIKEQAKKEAKDFTRKRKLSVDNLICYNLNKRGLTTKMELEDFIELCNIGDVSSPALLKQREKLNPEVFKYLHHDLLKDFYTLFQEEVKTYKGYILSAIDGSEWEIPNTKQARQRWNPQSTQCARAQVSNCYDVLNCYVLDTEVKMSKHSELDIAKTHLKKTKEIVGNFPVIRIMDRGYNSLSEIYHSIKANEKFVIRIQSTFLKSEQKKMQSDDEWVEVEYEYNRIRNWKDKDPEFYHFLKARNILKVRFVKVELDTGEIEVLMTNLEQEKFSSIDLEHIYRLRWGIETNFHYLKESMKMTNISSSKEDLIKQEIYSQMLVFNMLQSIQNEVEEEIDQSKYKHKMKINSNMAIGYIKRYMIIIFLEEDLDKRNELYQVLHQKILKHIIPVRNNRKYDRNKVTRNKHHINKRKSF